MLWRFIKPRETSLNVTNFRAWRGTKIKICLHFGIIHSNDHCNRIRIGGVGGMLYVPLAKEVDFVLGFIKE